MSGWVRWALYFVTLAFFHALAALIAWFAGWSHDAALLRVMLGFVVLMFIDEVAA